MSLTTIQVIVTEQQRQFFEKHYKKAGGAKSLSDFLMLAGYRKLRDAGVHIPPDIEANL